MEGHKDIKKVISYWMEGEINNFIKVWLSVSISLCYCYLIGKIIPKGNTTRLFTIFPVICLFLFLPLYLQTMHLGVVSAFFIAWLGNFKLLMFSFGKGPLSDPSISLLSFIAVACLPIKLIQQNNPTPKSLQNPQNNTQNCHIKDEKSSPNAYKKGQRSYMNYAIKGLLLALILKVYDYSEFIHPNVIWFIYCLHIYFSLELILALAAALVRALLGVELEPQFNQPHLSTSLQQFWGRRWNLMVTRILRPTVYEPVLNISTRILGRQWAPLPAILGTFIVSGLMHELIFYYMGRRRPTWEITSFFLFHGVSLMAEIAVKKIFGSRFRLPTIISTALTVGFVLATGIWLFLPELLQRKADVRAFQEYAAVGAFVKDVGSALAFKSFINVF